MKTKFIAEISSNHNQNIKRCIDLIDAAKDIGCWGVKFQLFKIEELFVKEVLDRSIEHKNRKKWELPLNFLPVIRDRCQKLELKFGCTPFYIQAVKELEPFVDFYKIASYELLWLTLFEAVLNTKKPLHFSTGIADEHEIQKTLEFISANKVPDIVMYHCTSSYPTPPSEVNLKAIETIKKRFGSFISKMNLSIGLSDHSVNAGVIQRAVNKYDCEYIEFHLDLDKKGNEFSGGHCWTPERIKIAIKNIEEGFIADGDGIIAPQESELDERLWRADPTDGLRPLKEIRNI